MTALATTTSGWQVILTGWPWWMVCPLALAGTYVLVRLHRLELRTVPARVRRRLLWLRGATLCLLVLFLMEPALTRKTTERLLPQVAVVVDQSGSMAVKDEFMSPGAKLSEAIGLGLLPASARPLKTNVAEQAASDRAVVEAANKASPVAGALAALQPLSRYDRAVKLARDVVVPVLDNRARIRVFGLDVNLAPLNLAQPAKLLAVRATDFEGALTTLARQWAQEYAGGVLLLTDGRQTAGADPLPVIRSLRARGALVYGIMVGDPAPPPDAVVAEISGGSEVFLGENVPLSVRYRVTGAAQADWDLVLSREGKEIGRRTVRGNGQWQYENFAVAATNAGINLYQARLELAREQSSDWLLSPAGCVTLELWNGLTGVNVVDLVNSPVFKGPATATVELSQLEYANRGSSYGARIRGFLVPPQDGNYAFGIASDDGSELWLSPTDDPGDKTRIAFVSGYVPRGQWSAQPSQRSQPVTLKAQRPYYFETLHKQGSGDDFLGVSWQLPTTALERPIPSSRLSPCNEQVLTTLAERKKQLAQSRAQEWKEASVANNAAETSVVVNQDPIKVLLVDSTPRWESRYLAAMFERDRRVSFTRRYHSVIIQEPGLSLLPRTQAEWDSYDMVCLGDLDANELPSDQQTCLANFVARRGGFLVCLAGPRGLPAAFSLGTLASVLPVRVSLPSSPAAEPVTVNLTAAGADHPVMQVLNDPGYNQKLWPLLPPLQWVADSVVAKPAATVLLAAQDAAGTPIVAVQRYGAGRVFWMGTEESWRWRDRLGERVHQTFWLQAMRWGLTGRLRGKDPKLQVGLDRYLMGLDESAELKARVVTATGESSLEPPMVKLEKIDDRGEVVADSSGGPQARPMLPMRETPGLWRLPVEALEEGLWRLTVSHSVGAGADPSESRNLLVRGQTGAEGLDLEGDLTALERMASAGGGRAATLDQVDALLKDFAAKLKPRLQERRETIRLWNSYLSLGVVVVLLCTEWVLRKRVGLP